MAIATCSSALNGRPIAAGWAELVEQLRGCSRVWRWVVSEIGSFFSAVRGRSALLAGLSCFFYALLDYAIRRAAIIASDRPLVHTGRGDCRRRCTEKTGPSRVRL